MKIHLYSESPAAGPGGAEHCVAILAEALSAEHAVQIVHHKPAEAIEGYARFAGCDLSRVTFQQVAMESDLSANEPHPAARYRKARAWRRQLSEGADLFVAYLHNKAPFCHAPRGVLISLFPTYRPMLPAGGWGRSELEPHPEPNRGPWGTGWLRSGPMNQAYSRWEWSRRMASYPVKLAISEFTRGWTAERWKIDCGILHPPVEMPDVEASEGREKRKQPYILSVGRFATVGHSKRQLEMLAAFDGIRGQLPQDWEYFCVGGVSDLPADQQFFEQASRFGVPGKTHLRGNVPREELRRLYGGASLFWHAAGYGCDEINSPEDTEHFGIATVEAMAAGCVPLVVNKGAQPEIVQHGISGFVWDTLEELQGLTLRLAQDASLRMTMAQAAQQRAREFSRESFLRRFRRLCGI